MRKAIILCALLCAAGIAARADIQQDVINRDPVGGAAGSGDTIDFGDTEGKFNADKIGPAIEELDDPNEAGPNAPDGKVNWEQLVDVPERFADGEVTSAEVSNTPAGDVTATDVQEAINELDSEKAAKSAGSKCIVIEKVTADDDNMPVASWPYVVTITGVWCQYAGSAPATAATFALEDGEGNAMTITGSNPACTASGTPPTPAAVTSGNALVAYEMLRFDTTNTPAPATDTYMICVGYSQ